MEEEARFVIRDSWFRHSSPGDDKCTTSSSIGEDSSVDSKGSSSDTETNDDASSLVTPSSSAGALEDLSDIMNQLPIKRGLSKFYQGKSESFVSLSSSLSIEDLAKKTVAAAGPYRRRVLKVSKSCGNGFSYKPYTLPKAAIAKRTTTTNNWCLPTAAKRRSFSTGKSGFPHLEC